MAAVCRLEGGAQMPVLTSRKSKRRFRVDSGTEAGRHRRLAGGVGDSESVAVKDSL